MLNLIWNFFRTAPDAVPMTDGEAIKKKFNAMRWRVFAPSRSVTLFTTSSARVIRSLKAASGLGYRYADGNRDHRLGILRNLRSWEIYQQFPGGPHE